MLRSYGAIRMLTRVGSRPASSIGSLCNNHWRADTNSNRIFSRLFSSDSVDEASDLVTQYGDNAPKIASVIAVPLTKKPIFPHFTASIIVKDENIANALIQTMSQSGNGGYIGLFYRKSPNITSSSASTSSTTAATADATVNVDAIYSENDIYHVGTFAQITSYNKKEVTVGAGSVGGPGAFGSGVSAGSAGSTGSGAAPLNNIVPIQHEFVVVSHRRITINEFVSFSSVSNSNNSNSNSNSSNNNSANSSSSSTGITTVNIRHWPKTKDSDKETQIVKAYVNEIFQTIREWLSVNPLGGEHIRNFFISQVDINDPCKVADLAAAMTTASGEELQRVIEEADCETRLQLALSLWNNEKHIAQLQKEINKQVDAKLSKQQREYFLREQMKSIKQELGLEKDEKNEYLNQIAEKLKSYQKLTNPPKNFDKITGVIKYQMDKLSSLDPSSAEYNVSKSYLEWLTSLPWDVNTQDLLCLTEAKARLDVDHFGLLDIKQRILEFIAVGVLKKKLTGKIMCFIGPPGVGKTSIAKSIASSLNRNFYRFSVGGLTDIAEIKGHRRTYIGAMPGKPIQALKSTGSINPLILIDEIDKLGRGHQGDPASALLELLDPNQNESFVDHYLDVPVDFSNVLFVCTANDEGAIPGPLRDRMEIIRLSGYDIPEKIAIATQYLVPKALRDTGLQEAKDVKISLPKDTLDTLIKNYCRESGVRNLERKIERLMHQLAFQYVKSTEPVKTSDGSDGSTSSAATTTTTISDESKAVIDDTAQALETERTPKMPTDWKDVKILPEDLFGYLGKPRYTQDTIYESSSSPLPVGVVMGLAWNPLGGSPIFIETIATPVALSETGGNVHLMTGQLGSVMKESVNIAYTYARSFIADRNADNNFFKCHQVHLHCPEGAVEKDGPSAGTAMAVAFVSLAMKKPVRPQVAMTGELSLTGRVLPIGGVKEKTLAARRTGANTIILPMSNKGDFEELPSYVKEAITVHFVSSFDEVYKICFEY